MSLRTMERLLVAGSLLLGVAAMGCGDDDAPPVDGDAGMDSGTPPGDGGSDARMDTGGGGGDTGPDTGGGGDAITCGSNTCTGTVIANLDVAPCCVDDGDVCGLDAADIKRASPSSPFTGCVPKDVEPDAKQSDYCGAFFDQIEPDGDHENGGLDIKSGTRIVVFDGCCLSTGECGANITVPRGAEAEFNSHLGCVSFARLRDAFEAQGEPPSEEQPDNLPFCDPGTGQVLTMGTVPGVPAFVCGCGEGNLDDGQGLPCLNNLQATVCGADAPTTEQLEDVPEFMCGCTANSKLPCLRNVAATTCGGKAIDASSAELAAVPEFICGCTADSKLPCMANVESTVCGSKPITSDSAELDSLPAFICGAVGLPAPTPLPTMPNVEADICGKKPITADSAELDAIPQFICGRTNNPQAAVLPTMANVDVAVCGKKVMTSDSAELNSIPAFMCGAVNNPDTSSLPKLRNVDVAICGKLPVEAGSPFLASVPKFLCGCTNNNVLDLGCLRNVDTAVCGAATPSAQVLASVPEFVCGCGADTRDSGFTRLCMSFVDVATCGTKQETVNDRGTPENAADDCLVGVPEYARGCGDAEGTTCLRRTAQLFGCDNVAAGPVRRIPEYLCGCGEAKPVGAGTADASLPCLPFVLETICGATPISASQQVQGIPNIVCGCGDGVTTQAAPCLDNVPPSICGAQQICVLGQSEEAAGCSSGQTCMDAQGGAGAGAGGAGGAGDGIGDHCVDIP